MFEINGKRRGCRDMIASASLQCFIYHTTITKYPYAFLSFSVMIIMNTKLDVLFRVTRAKHAMCMYPRELGRLVFTLAMQLICTHRLCSVDNNSSASG